MTVGEVIAELEATRVILAAYKEREKQWHAECRRLSEKVRELQREVRQDDYRSELAAHKRQIRKLKHQLEDERENDFAGKALLRFAAGLREVLR